MTPLLLPAALAASGWPEISVAPASTGGGERDAAVLVGIENYANLPDITGAGVNIADWQSWLLRTRGVRPVAISRRLDGDAVDVNIREALRDAVAKVQPGGTLWVVYVGHGAPSDNNAQPMLVGADAQPSPDGIRSRSVLLSEVQQILAEGPQAHTVLVLDACFSGQGVDGRELVAERLAPARGVPDLVAPKSMTLLAATSNNQYAGLLPGTARPAFSYLLLGALRGWGDDDGDGIVTAREAGDYAAGALNLVVTGRRQEPRTSGELDVTLGRGRERGPDLSALSRATTTAVPGDTAVNLGGNTDFARAAAVARAKEEEARRMLEAAAQARAEAEAERRKQLDTAAAAVLSRARADWAQVKPLLTADAGAETAAVVEAYVRQYAAASVTVHDVTEVVAVPEVALAERALAELERRVREEAPAEASSRRAAADEDDGEVVEWAAVFAKDDEEEVSLPTSSTRREEGSEHAERPTSTSTRSEARVEPRTSGSAKVPLLVFGGIVGAAGGAALVAAAVSEAQVLANIESGATDLTTGASQQDTVNTTYALGYAGLGVGLVLGGIGIAVPVDGRTLGLVVTGRW